MKLRSRSPVGLAAGCLCLCPFMILTERSEYFNLKSVAVPLVGFCFFAAVDLLRNWEQVRFRTLHLYGAVFMMMCVLNLLCHRLYPRSVSVGLGLLTGTAVLLTASIYPFTDRQLRWIINSYLFAGVIVSGLLLFQKSRVYSSYRFTITIGGGAGQDPNYLAAFLLMPALVALLRVLKSTCGLGRLSYGLLFLLISGAVLMTGSRAALLALVPSTLITAGYGLFVCPGCKPFITLLLLGAAIVLLLWFWLPQELYTRFFQDSYFDLSNTNRWKAWDAAIRMLIDRPLLGNGFSAAMELAEQYGVGRRMSTHNAPLELLAEMGIAGFLPFALVLFELFRGHWGRREWPLLAVCTSTLLTALIVSAQVSVYFWLNLILVLITAVRLRKDGEG